MATEDHKPFPFRRLPGERGPDHNFCNGCGRNTGIFIYTCGHCQRAQQKSEALLKRCNSAPTLKEKPKKKKGEGLWEKLKRRATNADVNT